MPPPQSAFVFENTDITDPEIEPTQIRAFLEDALVQDETNRAFSFAYSHSSAPNPLLHIPGLGDLGLPVPKRDFELVQTHCSPWMKSAEHGGQPCWQVREHRNVAWRNPSFDEWLLKTVTTEARRGLGIEKLELVQPTLLAVDGAVLSPDLCNANYFQRDSNFFAKLLVILPMYDDIRLSVRHPEPEIQSVSYNAATVVESSKTGIVAWYHGATPQVETKFLALTFDVVYTGTSPLPVLPSRSAALSELRRVLWCWLEDRTGSVQKSPPELVFLLDQAYPRAALLDQKLNKNDQVRTQNLYHIAQELGLHVFLVNGTYRRTGSYANWRDYSFLVEYYDNGLEDEYEDKLDEDKLDEHGNHELDRDEDYLDLSDWTDWTTRTRIEALKVSDIDVSEMADEGMVCGMIPSYRLSDMSTPPTHEDYDEDSGSLTHSWQCSAVVLWNSADHAATTARLFSYKAVEFLNEKFWKESEVGRLEFARNLVRHLEAVNPVDIANNKYTPGAEQEIKKCAHSLLQLAFRHKDFSLVVAVIQALGTGDMEILASVKDVFGDNTEEMENILHVCIKQAPSLLEKVKAMLRFYSLGDLRFLPILDNTLAGDDFSRAAVNNILSRDLFELSDILGLEVFTSRIVPKLRNFDDGKYWIGGVLALSEQTGKAAFAQAVLPSVVSAHKIQISQPQTRRMRSHPYTYSYHGQTKSTPGAETRKLFQLCLWASKPNLAGEMALKSFDAALSISSKTEQLLCSKALLAFVYSSLVVRKIPLASNSLFVRFFQFAVLHQVELLGPRPAVPLPGNAYAYPALLCKTCAGCSKINTFLTSPSRTAETFHLDLGGGQRKHYTTLTNKYPAGSLDVRMYQARSAPTGTLTLMKKRTNLEYENQCKRWEKRRSTVAVTIESLKKALGAAEEHFIQAASPNGQGWTMLLSTSAKSAMWRGEVLTPGVAALMASQPALGNSRESAFQFPSPSPLAPQNSALVQTPARISPAQPGKSAPRGQPVTITDDSPLAAEETSLLADNVAERAKSTPTLVAPPPHREGPTNSGTATTPGVEGVSAQGKKRKRPLRIIEIDDDE